MKEQKVVSSAERRGPAIPAVLFLSWFYTGKAPKAPGTVGSLATLPLIYLLHYLEINIYSLLALVVVLYLAAVAVAQHIQQKYQLHDPQWIVIDEVIGMLVTWAFVRSVDFPDLFLVFALFRLFDIVKVWPASVFDRLHHGVGTITDDVVSGIYAGIIAYFVRNYL
jgi:phosphatidylglycerophosphatase A